MRGTWSFYNPATGELSPRVFSGNASLLAQNTPAGLVAVEGAHDRMVSRVDVAALALAQPGDMSAPRDFVVPWTPPASHPAVQDLRRTRAREIIARAESAELRVVREWMLSLPNLPPAVRSRLEAIEATIVAAREDLA